jgi:hypothetical protein
MSIIVADCPRCGASLMTFEVMTFNHIFTSHYVSDSKRRHYEIYCVCKSCKKGTIFNASQLEGRDTSFERFNWSMDWDLKEIASIGKPVTPADLKVSEPPEHLPLELENMFKEGAKCMAISCYNAAGTMFRLCLDYATKELLPHESEPPNKTIRRSLGFRMNWLFDNAILPVSLRDLAECVKDDGNDGAHEGTLDKESAEDLEDFTCILLERLYTEKKRISEAKIRRELRKAGSQ